MTPLPTESASYRSRISPWMMPVVYVLGRYGVLPFYFHRITVLGAENLPHTGPLILAPTHRSRWDALIVPYAVGRYVTGRDVRFMVSQDEMKGVQGWFISRLGGFPIDPKQPAIASLRHGVDLVHAGEMLAIFPEGNIFRERKVEPLRPGLARLAVQSETSKPGLGLQIVPIGLHYSQPIPCWRTSVTVNIGKPLRVADYPTEHNPHALKAAAKTLTADLQTALQGLMETIG